MGSTEVAALLGISPATVARAVQTGRLVPSEVTPGGHSRFSDADVQAFRRRGRRAVSMAPIQPQLEIRPSPLIDLPGRIDASLRARHGAGLSDGEWAALLNRMEELSDAILEIIERPSGDIRAAERRMAAALAESAPPQFAPAQPPSVTPAAPLAQQMPVPVHLPEPATASVPNAATLPSAEKEPDPSPAASLSAGASTDPNPDTTVFEDGNSGITLIVKPIERFALIETITGLLAAVQGVGEIRLRRLQRGVAWFTIRYAGSLPPTAVFPRALATLSADVTTTGERVFEATLPRTEPPVVAGARAAAPERV